MTNDFDNRTRVYINWAQFRPRGWRGWISVAGFLAVAVAVLALIAIVASTLLFVALIVGLGSAVAFFLGNLFSGKSREVGPYKGNWDDARD
jgi:fatty acid desaturase